MQNTKKTYETPQLQVHGRVEELTQAQNGGLMTDETYTAGTPIAGHTYGS